MSGGPEFSPFSDIGFNQALDRLPPPVRKIAGSDEIREAGATMRNRFLTEMGERGIDPHSPEALRYMLGRSMELIAGLADMLEEELKQDDQRRIFDDGKEGTGEKIPHLHQGQQGSAGDPGGG